MGSCRYTADDQNNSHYYSYDGIGLRLIDYYIYIREVRTKFAIIYKQISFYTTKFSGKSIAIGSLQ